jgi:cysteine desulfurase
MKQVYLDNAATTPLREEVIGRMHDALRECYGNPSSTHAYGRTARTGIEKARKTIARELNAQAGEIIFTSGGTEADNMLLRCAVRDLGVETLITSRIEHHAVLHTAQALREEYGIRLEYVPLDKSGNPELSALERLLSADASAKLVSLMHVNNEIGNLLDLEAVGSLCRNYNALFHSDTVQSIGHFPWDLRNTSVDFLTAAAHKFHGPKGVGFAYIRRESGLKPLILGGSQERGFRAGTEAYHNIVGLETAFEEAYRHLDEEKTYIAGLKAYFIEEIKRVVPGVVFNGLSGDLQKSTYTLVNLRLPFDASKGLMLQFHLDLKGIACSKGSACQSGSAGGSHVLSEILDEEALALPSLRFSFSRFNTKEELDYVIAVLEEFAKS